MAIISDKKFDRSERNSGMMISDQQSRRNSLSLIGKNLEINGEIEGDEDLTIEGNVKGTIAVNAILIIGKQGSVNADIKAKAVVIMGKAEGKIVATDRVEIATDGQFLGDVHSKKLIIKEGAIFKGNVNMEDVPDFRGPAVRSETQKPLSSSQTETKK